jgi:hypothetical protein
MSWRGFSKRLRSLISAIMVTAAMNSRPRRALDGSHHRQQRPGRGLLTNGGFDACEPLVGVTHATERLLQYEIVDGILGALLGEPARVSFAPPLSAGKMSSLSQHDPVRARSRSELTCWRFAR